MGIPPVTPEEGKAAARAIFEPFLEAEGITPKYLAEKLKEELEAEETVFAKFEGKITDQVNVVAWDVRQRARIDAHKLRADYPAEKYNIKLGGEVVILKPDDILKPPESGS